MSIELLRPSYRNVPGNLYDKYNTRNPIARHMVANFIGTFLELAEASGAKEAFEVGCGEGMLSLELLRRGWNVKGVDLEDSVVRIANAAVKQEGFGERFEAGDIYQLKSERAGADLVICCEVMEHLPEPEEAFEILRGLARPWMLLSVPREPLWRMLNMARGKYLSRLGNTPGHIQHWSKTGFVEMVSRKAEIVAVRAPVPWTMLLCRVR